jgi:hypothetical protein
MIAKASGEHRAFITAVYWEIYDYASRNSPRGSLDGIDYEEIAFSQEVECHTVSRIVTSMCDKGFITSDNFLEIWDREQPLREDDGAAERKRLQRQREKEVKKQKLISDNNDNNKPSNNIDSHDNHDMSHNVTQCHDIQQDKQTKQTSIVVKEYNISSVSSCSQLSTESSPKNVDNSFKDLWGDLNFNDIIVCIDVCCALLGKEKLDELDAAAIQDWHHRYDMGWIIAQMRIEITKRVKEKKPTNSLRFFAYLTKKAPVRPQRKLDQVGASP